MNTLFALVINICGLSAGSSDTVIEIYDTETACQQAMFDQRINGECFPVDGIVHQVNDQPAQ